MNDHATELMNAEAKATWFACALGACVSAMDLLIKDNGKGGFFLNYDQLRRIESALSQAESAFNSARKIEQESLT